MQNIVLLMEQSARPNESPLKAGNMLMNRFLIDDDADFESTGVYHLHELYTSTQSLSTYEKNKG